MTVIDYASEIFAFIEVTYGENILNQIKEKKNYQTVDRIIEDSVTRDYPIDKTAHKIMAMLRIVP